MGGANVKSDFYILIQFVFVNLKTKHLRPKTKSESLEVEQAENSV